MGFTVRFILGVTLVLAVCSSSRASPWRRIRQAPLPEAAPEVPILHDGVFNASVSDLGETDEAKKEVKSTTVPVQEALPKPKTETSTEQLSSPVNSTNSTPAPNATDSQDTKDSKEQKAQKKKVLENVPERSESGRSLDIDISKYVSPEFHNKNNVYSFSVSPETARFTNLHKELPKPTTSRLQTSRGVDEPTTPAADDLFDKKLKVIEEGVKQKLEYIDHEFEKADSEFKKPDEPKLDIEKIIDQSKNDSTVTLNYTKYKNVLDSDLHDKNKIHKESDIEVGENVDFSSSYNKTQVFEKLPKDYKNRIPSSEDVLSEVLPDHSEVKPIFHVPEKTTERKHIDVDVKAPEIINKESTSLTKPPSLNQTENHKAILSNKIETESVNPAEGEEKIPWDIPYVVTPATSTISSDVKKSQPEEVMNTPFSNSTISVSKRGSTKFVESVKDTTEQTLKKNVTELSRKAINKYGLANKENKTLEQSLQENQVSPEQTHREKEYNKNMTEATTKLQVVLENSTIRYVSSIMDLATTKPLSLKPEVSTKSVNEDNITKSTNLIYDEIVTQPININMEQMTISESTTSMAATTTNWVESLTTTEPTVPETTRFDEAARFETTSDKDMITTEKFITSTLESSTSHLHFSKQPNTPSTDVTITSMDLTTLQDSTTSESAKVETTTLELERVTTAAFLTSAENSNITTISVEDNRSSNGRDLKQTTNLVFTSPDDRINNLDYRTIPITTESLNVETSNPTIRSTTKDSETFTLPKEPSTPGTEETSEYIEVKTTIIASEKRSEYKTNQPTERSTLIPRIVLEDITSETPLIIPLNISVTTDTDGVDVTTTTGELGLDEKMEGNGGPIAAIVISCIGAACLVLLAGLLFVMRKRHKRFNYGQRCTPVSLDAYSVDNVSVYNSIRRKGQARASKRSYGNPAFDDPTSSNHPMNFPALAKFANDSEGIAKEFEEVPQITAQTNELPEGCETKNRYANVIPLPETRVLLTPIDGYPNSDYINANYVTGPRGSKNYYIACQAPMQNTVDDFWRMVWEQQSKVILMITHLFENGTEKCTDYLPPSEVLDCHRLFGDFQITLKKREVKEKYVISSLQLKNMVSNSWREVTHLWYLGWPEKGVPVEANSLIAFLIEARSYYKNLPPSENGKPKETISSVNGSLNSDQNPVVVHCSPGTGRTGAVIACDIAIREFELTRQVDIPKTVYRIRRDRASSVQTKEQYEFIYKVICLYATKLTGGVLDSL